MDYEILKQEYHDIISTFEMLEISKRTNDRKRIYYHKLERLYEKLEDFIFSLEHNNSIAITEEVKADTKKLMEQINTFELSHLRLEPFDFPSKTETPLLYYFYCFDMLIRGISMVAYLIFASLILLPLMGFVAPTIDIILQSILRLSGKWLFYNFLKQFSSLIFLTIIGIFVTVEGKDNCVTNAMDPLLICFQHASNLDGFTIFAFFPKYFRSIAKKDIFLVPWLSWTAFLYGTLPINRHNRTLAIKQMSRGSKTLTQGISLALSPEGTRSSTGQLLRFKKGPFYTREEACTSKCNVAILPVLILGTYELWPPDYKFTCAGQCKIKFLSKLDQKKEHDLSNRNVWKRKLRDNMMDQIDKEINEACEKDRVDAAPLTWSQRIIHEAVLIIFWIVWFKSEAILCNFVGLNELYLRFYIIIFSVFITGILYFGYAKS